MLKVLHGIRCLLANILFAACILLTELVRVVQTCQLRKNVWIQFLSPFRYFYLRCLLSVVFWLPCLHAHCVLYCFCHPPLSANYMANPFLFFAKPNLKVIRIVFLAIPYLISLISKLHWLTAYSACWLQIPAASYPPCTNVQLILWICIVFPKFRKLGNTVALQR